MKTSFLPTHTLGLLLVCFSSVQALAQSFNYFAGENAGTRNTTGTNNTFVGAAAGFSNTTGSTNSFVGSGAGYFNTSGNFNSFFGTGAGAENGMGERNSFFGYHAGRRNTTGNRNSFFGYQAGEDNTTGASNTFVGYQAGEDNTEGSFNTFMGYSVGQNNTTGNHNVFIGYEAGNFNTTGNRNSFVGFSAGYDNKEGQDNAFLGFQSGQLNNNGNSNSFLGMHAGLNNRDGNNNTFVGRGAGFRNGYGSDNLFLGRDAGHGNVTGSGNTILGTFATTTFEDARNATAIGYQAAVAASNSLVLGAIAGTNGADSNTNVGIRTTAPGYALHVNADDAAKVGGGQWIVASDRRLKKEITEFTDGLGVVEKIQPVWYRYNGKAGIASEKKYVGVIAQDMQQLAPYTVGTFTYRDSTGKQEQYLDYDGSSLTYLLVNAVKELKAENDFLKQELAQIKQLLLSASPANPTPARARLEQNEPNPATGTSVIRYVIPENATSAQLKFYSLKGQEVHSVAITQKGAGSFTSTAGLFAKGVYIYHLIIDGQSVGHKKMLVSR